MNLICLDLEGVLVPEIWIAVAKNTGIPELELTTRDVPDYDKLMKHRLSILDNEGIGIVQIQDVIARIDPLDGALDFLNRLRKSYQVIILSDTFEQFARPIMKMLQWPSLFCNTLVVDQAGRISDYRLRIQDGKLKAVRAFASIGMRVAAVGDSYNDLGMIDAADFGALFRPPDRIRTERADLYTTESYSELESELSRWANTT